MNPCVISRAILSRIQADTGTGGLYSGPGYKYITGANYNLGAPESFTNPYLIWEVDIIDDHAQGAMGCDFNVTFTANENSRSATDNLEIVIDRLTGDSVLVTGSNGVPTYGFHNHLLVLPTNTLTATATQMTRVSAHIAPDGVYLVGNVVFKGRASASAVNL